MEQIQAKQVQGAVDTRTDQDVDGLKTFMSPVVFNNMGTSHSIIISGGMIYWAQDINNRDEEGNFRMGVDQGLFVQQAYNDGNWNDINK